MIMGETIGEALEKDLKRIIGSIDWRIMCDITGNVRIEKGDYIAYVGLPPHMHMKIMDHIHDHPQSRLAKSHVGKGTALVFSKTKALNTR